MKITSNSNSAFQQKVLDTIKSNHLMEQGDEVVVGVSGGPDSVCLLHVLHSLSVPLDIKIHAIHINHMLRAEEANADEAYTAGLCNELGIPYAVVRINIAEMADKLGMSLEEAGREARYREFDAYARSIGASRIAVAHNRNDQAETVMMHIIRGSGTAGLAGMEFRRGAVIRPLLNIGREEIEQYCREAGLFPRTDSSNLKSDFTRNRVRLELFPTINKSYGTDIVENLCRLSAHAADDNRYLDQCAGEAYKVCLEHRDIGREDTGSIITGRSDVRPPKAEAFIGRCVSLRLKQLRELHPAMLVRVLKLAVCDVAGSSTGLGSVHYNALTGLVAGGRTGARAELPRGLRAAVSYDRLDIFTGGGPSLLPDTEISAFNISLIVPGTTPVPELQAFLDVSVETAETVDNYEKIRYNSLVQFFDYDSLKKGINIRNRRDGDIFKPYKSNGSKKLKEYFIDNKIPRERRDQIPLVCMDKEIVWVIGHKISDKFKVTENTKSVLKMEYNRRASL